MKSRITGNVRVDSYAVMSDAVDKGIDYGIMRAYKYTDKPSADTITEEIRNAVMGAICDKFNFDGIQFDGGAG